PVAAYAEIADGELALRALAIRPDGSHVVEGTARVGFDLVEDDASGTASIPFLLGAELAADLIERGAGEILEAAKA
ncbi:MAG: hydroxymethylbilane synthase, partial [Brachybacterium tyrofermentans]